MRCSDLAVDGGVIGPRIGERVVLCYKCLQGVEIGSIRGFPSRLGGCRIEVVWKAFGLRLADLPARGEACVGRLSRVVNVAQDAERVLSQYHSVKVKNSICRSRRIKLLSQC